MTIQSFRIKKEEGRVIAVKYTGTDRIVTVPEGVTEIGENAFSGKTLNRVIMPDSVKIIREGAFSECRNLTAVVFSGKLKKIERKAFYNCENLKAAEFPDSLEEIGSNAFSFCRSIREIELPEAVRKIESFAFNECRRLEKISLPKGLNVLEDGVFKSCVSLTEAELPEGLREVKTFAFSNCDKLIRLKIPESVEKIDAGVVLGCKNLRELQAKQLHVYSLNVALVNSSAMAANLIALTSALAAFDCYSERGRQILAESCKIYENHILGHIIRSENCYALEKFLFISQLSKDKCLEIVASTENYNIKSAVLSYLNENNSSDRFEL